MKHAIEFAPAYYAWTVVPSDDMVKAKLTVELAVAFPDGIGGGEIILGEVRWSGGTCWVCAEVETDLGHDEVANLLDIAYENGDLDGDFYLVDEEDADSRT